VTQPYCPGTPQAIAAVGACVLTSLLWHGCCRTEPREVVVCGRMDGLHRHGRFRNVNEALHSLADLSTPMVGAASAQGGSGPTRGDGSACLAEAMTQPCMQGLICQPSGESRTGERVTRSPMSEHLHRSADLSSIRGYQTGNLPIPERARWNRARSRSARVMRARMSHPGTDRPGCQVVRVYLRSHVETGWDSGGSWVRGTRPEKI